MNDDNQATHNQAEGHKVLLELEAKFNKKPRSTTLNIQGSQIQAISGFQRIFEQYPYPVVINAAVLKLADWFRTYNNTVKYYVYKIFKEVSDEQLSKVINTEETVRRILPVLGSNDPIARSITLRILGCLSIIIAEKLDVQYGIMQRLELASDRIELEAAIHAGDLICAQSNRFPLVIFSKITEKLKDDHIPIDIRIRLIKIFRHMHQDIAMAREAKSFCMELLNNPNTDSQLVITTLRTLTLLLSEAVIDRKELIDRLLNYALNDEREEIVYNVLYDLVLLGRNDIMFDETHIIRLLRITSRKGIMRTQLRAFKCVQILLESHQKLLLHIFSHTSDSEEWNIFYQLLLSCEHIINTSIAHKQFTLMVACGKLLYCITHSILNIKTHLNHSIDDDNKIQCIKELANRITHGITQVNIDLIQHRIQIDDPRKWRLRELLKIKARFCLLLNDWNCNVTFLETFKMLTDSEDETAIVLLPYLSVISRKCTNLSEWFPANALEELKKRIDRPTVFVNLARLLIRTIPYPNEYTAPLLQLIYQFGQWNNHYFIRNGWNIYRIGVEAGMWGWYELMHIIMRDLRNKTQTEECRYWLTSLSLLASAEHTLSTHDYTLQKGFASPVIDKLIQSLNELKALEVLDKARTIQLRYIQLRMEMVNIIQYTLAILNIEHQDDISVKRQLRHMNDCAVRYRKLAFRYDHIAQSHIGIDNEILRIFESYKMCALICEHAGRTFVGSKDLFFCIDPSLIPFLNGMKEDNRTEDGNTSQSERLMALNRRFLECIIRWEEVDHPDNDQRRRCADEMKSMLTEILSRPLILPRSFFHSQKIRRYVMMNDHTQLNMVNLIKHSEEDYEDVDMDVL